MSVQLDVVEIERARTAVRTARALGIKYDPNIHYTEVEKLIAEKQKSLGGGTWMEYMAGLEIRRKKAGAAYIAGVSMQYLAELHGVSRNAMQRAIMKALPNDLRMRIAEERVKKVALLLNPTQASLALNSVTDEEAKTLDIIVLAAKMREAAIGNDDVLEPESRIGSS